jgi:segregation and condensation protein B
LATSQASFINPFSRKKTVILEYLAQHVEALIFASESPISREEIAQALEGALGIAFDPQQIDAAIGQLRQRYQQEVFAFEVVEISGGLQFMTKGAYHPTVAIHLKQTTRKKLSQAALETLAIIAYKQPVTKSDLESIRGVNCDYTIQKLLEKELVSIAGRSEGVGRPLLYSTSEKFMDYFGIRSLDEMPKLRDFASPENTIGEQAPLEETFDERVKQENENAS